MYVTQKKMDIPAIQTKALALEHIATKTKSHDISIFKDGSINQRQVAATWFNLLTDRNSHKIVSDMNMTLVDERYKAGT